MNQRILVHIFLALNVEKTQQGDTTMSNLKEWQGHRGINDNHMADLLGVCRQTWVKWRDGKSPIPHKELIRAINLMQVPKEEAIEILMTGYKPGGKRT